MKRASWPVLLVGLGLSLFGLAQDAPQKKAAAPGAQADAKTDQPIDFEKAKQLRQKQGKGEKLTADEDAYLKKAIASKQGKGGGGGGPDSRALLAREKVGLTPLTEMTASDRYLGEDGGLYGKGQNVPPPEHRKAAEAELAKIQPLNADGKPAKDGKIVFVSISMSNATQEFSYFKRVADEDPAKSKLLTIVDCAQGGQAMAQWVDPQGKAWLEADKRLSAASISPQQVQVAWIKLANVQPRGELTQHGKKLQQDTTVVLQNARSRFPNLRIAYLGSRIYGGYSSGALNPEPYAYEGAFAARWLIQDQIKGDAALNYDASRGAVKSPLLLWGPYLWGDGMTPRKSDGLVWKREDVVGDGTHPSEAGRAKVTRLLLDFCKTDPLAKSWFTEGGRP
jgi:hypothetical protein